MAAAMYSLVSSASRYKLDVWAYVDDCLRQLASGSTDYESLLPDVWRQSHPTAIRTYRAAEAMTRRLTTQAVTRSSPRGQGGMMAALTERIQLTIEYRDLIREHLEYTQGR